MSLPITTTIAGEWINSLSLHDDIIVLQLMEKWLFIWEYICDVTIAHFMQNILESVKSFLIYSMLKTLGSIILDEEYTYMASL